MGQSTDAILCYGVSVPEEFVEEFLEHDDEAEHEAEKERNPLGYMAFMGSVVEVDDTKVALISHQSSDYPRYFVAIASTKLKAWRGHPKAIDAETLRVHPTWPSVLRKFCEQHGVPWEEPQWWIASDWS